jgi:hypothetical protein
MKVVQDQEFKVAIFVVGETLHVTVVEQTNDVEFADSDNELTQDGERVIAELKERILLGEYPNIKESDEGVPNTFAYTKIRRSEIFGSSYIIIVR